MIKPKNEIKEAVSSVLPITCIVSLLGITIIPMLVGTMLLFTCGVVMLIIGIGLFSLGADMPMTLMGEGIGIMLSASKKRYLMVCITFIIGFIIAIVEPDLTVLAYQIPGVPGNTLIQTVVAGVGFFLVMALLRIPSHWNLKCLLMLFYALVSMLTYFPMGTFMTVVSDSSGVITGPTTAPSLMTPGIGTASVTQKHAEEESFGTVVLCNIGLILAVLLPGILYEPQGATYTPFEVVYAKTSKDVTRIFLTELPHYMWGVSKALLPILRFSLLFQLISSYFNKRTIIKVFVGALYTFLGLILFLCGVNVGFIPAGYFIGTQIATLSYNWTLAPIGVLIGFFIVKAEPAMHVLTCQVEDTSSDTTPAKAMLYSLSIGVGIPLGIAMLCISGRISVMILPIPRYLTAVILSLSAPNVFTGIAFGPGGMVNGPMTATFLLSSATGAREQPGGNVLLNTSGIVAIAAVTPLLTIQILGLVMTKHKKTAVRELQEDNIMGFEEIIGKRTEN